MPKLSDDTVEAAHLDYALGRPATAIATALGVSTHTLYKAFRGASLPLRGHTGVRRAKRSLAYDLLEAHFAYMSGVPADEVALACGIGASALVRRFKSRGLETMPACARPIVCVEAEKFNPVSTKDAAYWLGFLAADGSLSVQNGSTRTSYAVVATLSKTDVAHVEEMARFIGGRIYGCPSKPNAVQYRSVTSPDWGCLVQYGFGGRKANRLVWPKQLGDFLPHYLRGFFDGDGSIWGRRRKRGSWEISWTVYSISKDFLEEAQQWLARFGVEGKLYLQRCKEHELGGRILGPSSIWRLMVFSKGSVGSLFELLYSDGGPRLERKHSKFASMMQRRANGEPKNSTAV